MAIPIINSWEHYFTDRNEGLGSSYERIIINKRLEEISEKYKIRTLLEAPSFGFTGLSGVNSMALAKKGIDVTLVDNNEKRLKLISDVWDEAGLSVKIEMVHLFENMPFNDSQFDMSWNFSSLWFASDIDSFLTELSRVTSKVIVLFVPNRTGLGYVVQRWKGKKELEKYLNESFIKPSVFIPIMERNGWELKEDTFIDCPPWPDIGMAKEDFLKMFGMGFLAKKENARFYSIMDYYTKKDPNFANEMISHFWFEKSAPKFIKKFWAHHHMYLFARNESDYMKVY